MKLDRETGAILWKASEDYAALWELPIALRSIGVPNPAVKARQLAERLMDNALIYAVWGDPEPNEAHILSPSEWQATLTDDHWWDENVPYGGRTVWVTTTEEGERIALDLGPL